MKSKPKSPALTVVEKYEHCKSRMLRTFLSDFKKNSNSKDAFDKAKGVIRQFRASKAIANLNQIKGLYGELSYFYKSFQEQELTPEMAIGYKGDFRGIIRGKPAVIDVTTNPSFKKKGDYAKIRGNLQNGWDYYLGVVNIRKVESELYPLMLPICKDDNVGFFVLVYDEQGRTGQNMYGYTSDLQYLIRYNPACGGDEYDAVEEVVSTYNYILGKPKNVVKEIYEDHTMYCDETNITPRIEKEIDKDINEHFNDIALFFRKLSGLTISAIVDTTPEVVGYKEVEDVTKQFWVHPHQYIRKNIGEQGEIMDYDIASHVHYNL